MFRKGEGGGGSIYVEKVVLEKHGIQLVVEKDHHEINSWQDNNYYKATSSVGDARTVCRILYFRK